MKSENAMAQPTQSVSDLASLFRLDGKIALVVGGYGGIGQVTCQMLMQFGAAVAIAGRSVDKAKELAGRLTAMGGRVIAAKADVSDRTSVDDLIKSVIAQLGGLDIVVNLSSIHLEAGAEDFPEADWRQVLDVNLSGAF